MPKDHDCQVSTCSNTTCALSFDRIVSAVTPRKHSLDKASKESASFRVFQSSRHLSHSLSAPRRVPSQASYQLLQDHGYTKRYAYNGLTPDKRSPHTFLPAPRPLNVTGILTRASRTTRALRLPSEATTCAQHPQPPWPTRTSGARTPPKGRLCAFYHSVRLPACRRV